ncbi:hypothetical protein [Paraburkholderia sediminicola]|uniref:hypothetical protein n=1 Tax=Paraburkholderia sediminicola TaxID=458836 RepID=UPI0038BA109B
MGFTGMRRQEAAAITRNRLSPLPAQAGVADALWEIAVLGKQRKWRLGFIPNRVIEALRAHWEDRDHDFDAKNDEKALLSPVVVPVTEAARSKHLGLENGVVVLTGNGFSADGLYQVVTSSLLRIASDERLPLDERDRRLLREAAPHALPHAFAI